MINNDLHYDGKDSLGHRIIIDAANLGYGKRPWEIMAMRPGGKEIAVAKTDTQEDAERIYTNYVCRFTASYPIDPMICEPLTGKYAKLRDDLASAFSETLIVEKTEDGGTCNFDSAVVKLPGWDRAKVKQAVAGGKRNGVFVEAGAHNFRLVHFSAWRERTGKQTDAPRRGDFRGDGAARVRN